jgi:ATP-dependent Clp protease protease subunit
MSTPEYPMTTEKDLIDYESPAQALQDHGIMLLMSGVSDDSVKPIIEWILHENHVRKKKSKELLLMVCSEGGDMASAFALIDVMRSSRIPIKTVGLGTIASAGLMIFLSGTRGRRILTPNTSIMSHQFHWGTMGKVHELFATVKEFELTHQRMIDLYRECTGLDDKKIAEILLPPQDVYLSAPEAMKYHICDHVADINAK